MSVLGCPDSYTVELRSQGGQRKVGMFDGVQSLTWGRVLTGTSECTVVIAPRSRDCARLLGGALDWAHEVYVWRDRDLVWCGPLIDKDDDGQQVTLLARDVTAWLPGRLIHHGYDPTETPLDLAALAVRALGDAYGPLDPDVIPHLIAVPAGIPVAERAVEPESVHADAELAALVALGLDWTTVGRCIAVFPASGSGWRIRSLGPKHFTGRLPVRQAGADVVTRFVVQGAGVRAEAGGIHPVYGLLERLVTQSTVTDEADAAAAARAGLVTPSLVLSSADLSLTARAPVTVAELVPGAVTTVSGRGAACEVSAQVLLAKVSVSWSAAGEAVGVTFMESGDRAVL